MAAFAHFLTEVAAKLTERGGQTSPRPLAVLSYGMSFLTGLGRPTDDDVALAGYLIAQFQLPDARALAVSLGVPVALIPTRQGDDVSLMVHTLARGTSDEAAVAAMALYAWFALHAQAGNRKDATFLQKLASSATLDGSVNRPLAAQLVRAMGSLAIVNAPALPLSEYQFSISIDLCGSTDAKTRVRANSQGNQAKIDHYNELIYRAFCTIEGKFFAGLVGRYGTGRAVDPRQLFTVKGIGDEMWTLCTVTPEDVRDTGTRLIDAAIEVANECVNLMVPEHGDDGHWTPATEYGHVEAIQSPIKIFIDLIEHATSIGTIRDQALRETVPDLLREYQRLERWPGRAAPMPDEDVAYIMRRLSLSSYEPIGRTAHSSYRTDYIGHEIDRFFRTTKSALPGTVSIGETMARRLGLQFSPGAHDLHAILGSDGYPLRGGAGSAPLYARPQTLTKVELKGIGYDYETFVLFDPLALNGHYNMMEAQRVNGGRGSAYDDTMKRLPAEAVGALAAQIVQDRAA